MGIGVVISDAFDKVMACLSASHPIYSHTVLTECWTLLRAIEFYEEFGHHQVAFEGDAQLVVWAIENKEECLAWYRELINEAKSIFCNYPEWSLTFIHIKATVRLLC